MTVTPEEVLALASKFDADAAQAQNDAVLTGDPRKAELAKVYRREAESMRDLARRMVTGAVTLRAIDTDMSQVQALEQDRPLAGRPLETDHPFPRALEAAGSSVAAWARSHRLKLPTVRSWYLSANKRRIPRRWARVIERELGVPATEEVWKNGIRG